MTTPLKAEGKNRFQLIFLLLCIDSSNGMFHKPATLRSLHVLKNEEKI